MKLFQHAASFATAGVIAVITAYTIQVNNRPPAPAADTITVVNKRTAFKVERSRNLCNKAIYDDFDLDITLLANAQ